MDLRKRADLNEISYGVWEGKTKEQVEQDFPDDYRNWLGDPSLHAPTDGETAVAVANRAIKTIDEIRNEFSDGEVLVVSHKATIRIIICQLLGMELRGFRYRLACPVGSLSVVEFTRQGPMLKVLADRCHLSTRLRNLPGT
jgi:probable phosphoglycerate mutase